MQVKQNKQLPSTLFMPRNAENVHVPSFVASEMSEERFDWPYSFFMAAASPLR